VLNSPSDLTRWPIKLPELQARRTTTDLPEYGEEKKLSGMFRGTLSELAAYCGDQGIIVAFGRGASADRNRDAGDDAEPTLYFAQWGGGLEASTALKVIADQLGESVQVLRRDKTTYVLGEPDNADYISRIYHVPDGKGADYKEAVTALGTSSMSISAVGDALVVRDTVEGIRTVDALFDAMQAARGQWTVDVRFVELTRNGADQLGIAWDLSGIASATAEILGVGPSRPADLINLTLSAVLEANAFAEDVSLITGSRLHVVEGQDAELQVGATVPVPDRSTVSDSGTVTRDFKDVDVGVLLSIGVRSEPDGRLRVTLQPEISNIQGFVEGRPIRSRRRLSTSAVVEPGGSLIAGGFFQDSKRAASDGLHPSILFMPGISNDQRSDDRSRVFVMVQVSDPRASPQFAPPIDNLPAEPDNAAELAIQTWRDDGSTDPAYLAWLLDAARKRPENAISRPEPKEAR
jgi:hypothetical protein